MAKLRIKAPDGKTLVVKVPQGTDPSQYDSIVKNVIAHYQQKPADPVAENAERIEPGVYGDTKPVEQKLAENSVAALNGMSMGYGIPSLIEGLGGLAMKGVGAIAEGMAPTAESLSTKLARAIPTGWKNLPENALKADQQVNNAAEWAMNPHPEIQDAISAIKGVPQEAAEAAEGAAPASESTVKSLTSGAEELPASTELAVPSKAMESALPTSDGGTVEGEVMGEKGAIPDVENVPEPGQPSGLFDKPIFSMGNMTPKSQLAHTEAQMKEVGDAIGTQLTKLNESGHMFDPASTAKQLEGMYARNASGHIIPAGMDSAQAIQNGEISQAIKTLTSEAEDADGVLGKLDWTRANGIKGKLQQLGEDTGSQVMKQAGRLVRDSIDEQATSAMAKTGGDISNFQKLRDAYSKLFNIHDTLNAQVRSALNAKNSIPVVRGGVALAGVATGNPGLTTAAATDFFGRKYGALAMARGLKGLSEVGKPLSEAGSTLAEGTMSPAAKGIASGLVENDDE